MRFANREHAGQVLARQLAGWKGRDDLVVLGLPRGGVVVAAEVARALDAPLDVLVVRKLGVPGHEEVAMGAIASGGVQVLDPRVVVLADVDRAAIARVVAREQTELARRERAFRGDRLPADLTERVVVLVDDGLATGSTMLAAVRALLSRGPARIVVAAPVGSAEACALVAAEADEVVCTSRPDPFYSVGTWYADFRDTPDSQVRALLEEAVSRMGSGPALA